MNESEIRKILKTLVKEIMNLDIDSIPPTKNLSEIDAWDSFNNLMLIAEVEKTFKVKYTAQELSKIITIDGIIKSLVTKAK